MAHRRARSRHHGRGRPRGNPWLAVLNKGRTLIAHGATHAGYRRHHRQGYGPWNHDFKRRDVDVYGLSDGRVLLESKGGARLWSKDGADRWLDNPGGGKRRARRANKVPGEIRKGKRVQLHAATSEWMQGDRYGEVVGYGRAREYRDSHTGEVTKRRPILVKLDKSGRVRRFHPDNLFEINRGKMKKRKGAKRRPPKGYRTWAAYMKSIRPNRKKKRRRAHRSAAHSNKGSNMARRRKHRRSRGRRRSHRPRVAHVIVNKRGRRRRFGRRNPPLRGIVGTIVDVAKGGAGVTTGKLASRVIPHLFGIAPTGLMGLGVQALAGIGAGWAVERFVSPGIGRLMLYGAGSNVIESLLRGWNIPIVSPGLADETEAYAFAGYPEARRPALPPVASKRAGVAGYPSPTLGDEDAGMPLLVMG